MSEAARAEARRLYEGGAEGNSVVARRLLAEQGVAVSVRTVERAVRDLRQTRRVAEVATVRVETGPGEQLQIDFGQKHVEVAGTAVRIHLLVGFSLASEVRSTSSARAPEDRTARRLLHLR